MSTIVDIVNPMLHTIVAAEGLDVLEHLPLPVDEAPHWMILNLLEHAAASAAVAAARSAAANSATAAALWQQRGGCGGGGSVTSAAAWRSM